MRHRYARALEEEVATLENLLGKRGIRRPDVERRNDQNGLGQAGSTFGQDGNSPAPPTRVGAGRDVVDISLPAPSPGSQRGISSADRHAEDVDMFSVGKHEAPAYVGPSAGISLAMNLGAMVQATVWKKAVPEVNQLDERPSPGRSMSINNLLDRSASASEELERRPAQPMRRRPMTREELAGISCKEPPSDELGARLVQTYLTYIHPLYPFLNPSELWEVHRRRMSLASEVVVNLEPAQQYSIFKLYMVYAAGATCLSLVEKGFTTPPEVRFSDKGELLSTADTDVTAELLRHCVTTYLPRPRNQHHPKHRSHGTVSCSSSPLRLRPWSVVHSWPGNAHMS